MLGLPAGIRACLFDLDGVLTRTAEVHAAAWAGVFDGFLQQWAARHGQPYVPFDPALDYQWYVDGKRREDGVRSFLASRGIALPEGTSADPPEAETVHGIGNLKNAVVLRLIAETGVRAYEGSVAYLHAARGAGMRTAVVSSSANCLAVTQAAGIADLLEVRVDGVVAAERGLPGKPAPDTFLEAARELGVAPGEAAVFEDALAGVEAGRAGKFGLVVGVDRVGHAQALVDHGADIAVTDLAELLDPS